jgi:hypothetical protein
VRASVSLLVLAAGALAGAPAASPERGVSIDVGRIAISQDLLPGGGYRLPTFGVTNPGSERTTYRLGVSYVEGQKAKRPPEQWFRFTPARLTLAPHKTEPVNVRLELPTSADPGDYAALIGPQIVSEGSGAQVGAAAAARLTFPVVPSSLLEKWWLRLKRFLDDGRPWSYLLPSVAVFLLLGWQLRKRLKITVSRRA